MKILLVNTYGHAGAANSCIRLHKGLLDAGYDSTLLLWDDTAPADLPHKQAFPLRVLPVKENRNESGRFARFLKKYFPTDAQIRKSILAMIPGKIEWFSFADTGLEIQEHPAFIEADIINFHWASGFVDYSIFSKISKPVVWTLHDMNPFTGGCHYSGTCLGYQSDCPKCPQLKDSLDDTYSAKVFKYKADFLKEFRDLTIVSPSEWLRKCSESSTLFSGFMHHTIPYGIDPVVFSPGSKSEVRRKLGLPEDKVIMLFVAFQSLYIKRKGYSILLEAISKMTHDRLCLLSVGGASSQINSAIPVIDFGFIKDEQTMSELYSAADFFVIPSLEDNLPNTVIESLLCGTPVAGFSTGGIPDMIRHGFNGVLAPGKDASSLFSSIMFMVENIEQFKRDIIRQDALNRFAPEIQARKYIELYNSILQAEMPGKVN